MLWAEWRAGQALREVERSSGPGRGHTEKVSQGETGFYALLDSHKLDKNTAYRWITMSHAPREAAEKYMDGRQEAGGPFKRATPSRK